MRYEPNIATVAALIGDPARAAILLALADGRALPAGELAAFAGLSSWAASATAVANHSVDIPASAMTLSTLIRFLGRVRDP